MVRLGCIAHMRWLALILLAVSACQMLGQDPKQASEPTKDVAAPAKHTVVFQFDYSGAYGMAPMGIPSKVLVTIAESKEMLVTAEAVAQGKSADGPVLKYRQTYHSKPVLQTEVTVPIGLGVRREEVFANAHVQFSYDDPIASFLGVASSAV